MQTVLFHQKHEFTKVYNQYQVRRHINISLVAYPRGEKWVQHALIISESDTTIDQSFETVDCIIYFERQRAKLDEE